MGCHFLLQGTGDFPHPGIEPRPYSLEKTLMLGKTEGRRRRGRQRMMRWLDGIIDSLDMGLSGLHYRLTRGVRPRLEGKPRTPLSSRVATRISWIPLVASVESSLLFILERGLWIVLQAM